MKSGRHFHAVIATGISTDSERIVSMDTGGTILVWDRSSGDQIRSRSFDVPVALSANGKVVIGATRTGFRILDTESGRYSIYSNRGLRWPFQAFLSASGELALVIDSQGNQSLLNTLTGSVLHAPFAHSYGRGYTARFAPAFNPDASKVLIASRKTPDIEIWDVESGKRDFSFPAHETGIRATAYSPDSREIISVGMDNRLKRWQARSGRLLGEIDASGVAIINRVAVAPVNHRIYTGHTDGSISIWKPDGELVSRFHAHEGWVESLHLSPDGRSLVSSGPDKFLRIWALES